MRLPLLLWPNLSLKEKSVELTQEEVQSEDFKANLEGLKETLTHFRGVGISAIQVDWPVRLFAMRDKDDVRVFINPVIVDTDGALQPMEEGCLSLPGHYEKVDRYPEVILEASDPDTWERKKFQLDGIEAQCAQHEIEHLDGIMKLTDGLGPVKRDVLKRKIKKQKRINPLFNGEA